jgi:hypothetical protein
MILRSASLDSQSRLPCRILAPRVAHTPTYRGVRPPGDYGNLIITGIYNEGGAKARLKSSEE